MPEGGEIDGFPAEFKFTGMRLVGWYLWILSGVVWAQEGSLQLSDLPSAEAKPKLPALEEPDPIPDFSGTPTPETVMPNPAVRLPTAPKADDADWAAQAMLQKKEESKKREEQQAKAALAEGKEREAQAALDKEKKEKLEKTKSSDQPVVAKAAVAGFGEADAQKLPVVTGLDGVKPRALQSGDGRVQPGFDSFTGPSGTGPLGKDFQSGAKPIMAGNAGADGRMQVPPKVPEPPSGGYKRISQDPNSFPPGYIEPKPVAPAGAKPPLTIAPNPDPGDTKRIDLKDTKAGYSPYDNSRKVPDPRSQRRF